LQPNIFFNESFGKYLFILFDLLCGLMILMINQMDNENSQSGLIFWFYNPLTIAISSRGNAESIMSFLVLIFIYFLLKKSFTIAGCLYALAIHFKIYPITYAFAILLFIVFDNREISFKNLFKRKVFIRLIKFSVAFLITVGSLTIYFYIK
jgi:phosphatidylinositol glycan class M